MWVQRRESGVVRFCVQPRSQAREVRLIGSFSGGRAVPMRRLAGGRFAAEVFMPAGDNWCRIVVTDESTRPDGAKRPRQFHAEFIARKRRPSNPRA